MSAPLGQNRSTLAKSLLFFSGIAALVQAVNPHLAARDLARRIERTAMPLCNDKAEQADAFAALFAVEPDSKQCR